MVAKRQNMGTFNANSSHRDEEAGKERRVMGASLLTNVLALADTLGVKKDFHVDADREYSFSNPYFFQLFFIIVRIIKRR